MNRLLAVVTCSCVSLSAGCMKPSASAPPPQASTAHHPDSLNVGTSDAEQFDAKAASAAETLATLKAVQTELELERDGKMAQYLEVKDLRPEDVPVTEEIIFQLSQNKTLLALVAKRNQAAEFLASLKTNHPNERNAIADAENELNRRSAEYVAESARQTLKLQTELIQARKTAYEEVAVLLDRCTARLNIANEERNRIDRERFRQERAKS